MLSLVRATIIKTRASLLNKGETCILSPLHTPYSPWRPQTGLSAGSITISNKKEKKTFPAFEPTSVTGKRRVARLPRMPRRLTCRPCETEPGRRKGGIRVASGSIPYQHCATAGRGEGQRLRAGHDTFSFLGRGNVCRRRFAALLLCRVVESRASPSAGAFACVMQPPVVLRHLSLFLPSILPAGWPCIIISSRAPPLSSLLPPPFPLGRNEAAARRPDASPHLFCDTRAILRGRGRGGADFLGRRRRGISDVSLPVGLTRKGARHLTMADKVLGECGKGG